MSRISSISTATRPKGQSTNVPTAPKAKSTALIPLPQPKCRAVHRLQPPQSAACYAQVLAGTPRRGLKGDPAEQARVFAIYARIQKGVISAGTNLKIVA